MAPLVVPHDPAWAEAFSREADALRHALGERELDLHHIGSTAIPGILAKPIIDMLGVVEEIGIMDGCAETLRMLGYEVMGPHGIEGRRYFRKSNPDGRRTHHLHVFARGSVHVSRHLAFRDFLRSHPAKAAEYSDLKARIIASGHVARDEYIKAKAPFVQKTERLALDWYRDLGQVIAGRPETNS